MFSFIGQTLGLGGNTAAAAAAATTKSARTDAAQNTMIPTKTSCNCKPTIVKCDCKPPRTRTVFTPDAPRKPLKWVLDGFTYGYVDTYFFVPQNMGRLLMEMPDTVVRQHGSVLGRGNIAFRKCKKSFSPYWFNNFGSSSSERDNRRREKYKIIFASEIASMQIAREQAYLQQGAHLAMSGMLASGATGVLYWFTRRCRTLSTGMVCGLGFLVGVPVSFLACKSWDNFKLSGQEADQARECNNKLKMADYKDPDRDTVWTIKYFCGDMRNVTKTALVNLRKGGDLLIEGDARVFRYSSRAALERFMAARMQSCNHNTTFFSELGITTGLAMCHKPELKYFSGRLNNTSAYDKLHSTVGGEHPAARFNRHALANARRGHTNCQVLC